MAQLGFTFYPKDWWTSDSFYTLNPFERYIYLELLFMMYDNGGSIKNDKVKVERRLYTTIKDDVWSKITDLMVEDGGQLTHKSIDKRLRKAIANRENGKKGGAPIGNNNATKKQLKNNPKTTKTTGCFENEKQPNDVTDYITVEKQPKQPKKTTQNNPSLERERENKEKEINKEKVFLLNGEEKIISGHLTPFLQEMLEDQCQIERLCMNNRIEPDILKDYIKQFFVLRSNENNREIQVLSDAQSYFARWLACELEKRKKDEPEPKPESRLHPTLRG